MVKDFKYCDNPEAEVPRLFIDKEIGGKDAEGIPNIDGNVFLRELMYVSDTLGKSKAEVWINSPGGIVTDGQSIYASIIESKANVDTVCYGLAASIAGVIFQAGKKRIMMDYAHLMYHPAYSEDGRIDKGLQALNNAICTMVATRTGKTEDEIWAIMNRGRMDDKGTWISAKEALEMGFCDEVRNSADKNKIDFSTAKSILYSANKVYNRIIEKTKTHKMKTVLNKLGLIEDANEASVVAAIDVINKKNTDLEKDLKDTKDKYDKLNSEMDLFKKNKADEEEKAKNKADEDAKNKKKADEEEMDKKADEEMKNAVTAGKIKNDAPLIASYKAMYLSNPEATKKVIEALPVTKNSASFVPADGTELKDSPAEAAARKNGLQPGTANWYNALKSFEIK